MIQRGETGALLKIKSPDDYSETPAIEDHTYPEEVSFPKNLEDGTAQRLQPFEEVEKGINSQWWELNEKIKTLILEAENDPQLFFSKDLLEELKSYIKVAPNDFQNISNNLELFLNKFTKKKLGVLMEEKTKKFIKNELIYLILKLREEKM